MMLELAEPVMGIAPVVVAALISAGAAAAKMQQDAQTKAPGDEGNKMDFGQDDDEESIEKTFHRETQQSPWMGVIGGNRAPEGGFGLDLQDPMVMQSGGQTMLDQFG